MDLNQLLFHHQVALMRQAVPLDCERERGSRFNLVRHYEARIARMRHDMGVPVYPQMV